jgi:hypothetical protein
LAGAVGVSAGLALAALPIRSASWLGEPVARTLGVGRLLSVGGEPGVAAGFAIVVMGAALVAFLIGPGHTVGDLATGELGRPPEPEGVAAPATADVRRWTYAAMFLIAVSLGVAVRVYLSAANRGFL